MKHTPGPWTCHSGMIWHNETPIARMDRDTPDTRPTERDANAQLIAAAVILGLALLAMLTLRRMK